MANIAYYRVSSLGQSLNDTWQKSLLDSIQIDKVFEEKISGKEASNRVELQNMLAYVREGDTLFVASIDRLARNTRDFLNILDELEKKQVKFVSMKENIDTSTPCGRFMVQVFASLAELERNTINMRRQETIKAMKAAGTFKTGRPKIEMDEKKFRELVKKWRNGEIRAVDVYKPMGIKRPTFYKKIKDLGL